MLTPEDIKQLAAVLTTKEDLKDFYTKSEMDTKFSSLQTSVDGLATIFKKYYEEQKIMTHRLERVEEWIKKVSDKLGVKFEV